MFCDFFALIFLQKMPGVGNGYVTNDIRQTRKIIMLRPGYRVAARKEHELTQVRRREFLPRALHIR